MALDLRTHAFLRALAASGLRSFEGRELAQIRAEQARVNPLVDVPRRPLARVEDLALPGPAGAIAAKLFAPEHGQALPLLVYFHGGGFVLGSPATHEGVCRTLAAEARCVVVSVDYRLAPEHPYPAAIDDALASVRHLREHARRFGGRGDRLAVAGDSAGGTLAASVCQRLRDAGEPQPLVQGLIYPCADLRRVHPSHARFGSGFLLTAAMLEWFYARYLPDPALAAAPEASPLLAERFDGLAPALILTAGFDPLRDEGRAYAQALQAAGVAVEYRCHARLIHGFFSLGGVLPAARAAVLEFADRLRAMLHGPDWRRA